MATQATFDGTNLPSQFRYAVYIQKKRNTTIPTANAVIVQYSDPQIVHGDSALAWSCEACYPTEFQWFYNKYNTNAPTLYTFVGYWGETYEVYFSIFDPPKVAGRLFDLSGQFQVISVTSGYSAVCSS